METPTKAVGAGSRGRTKRPPALSPVAAAATLVGTKAARLTHGRGASGLILCSAVRKYVRKPSYN